MTISFLCLKDIFYVVEQTLNNTNDITVIIPNAIGLNNSGNSKFSNILYKKFPSIKDNIELSNKQQLGSSQYIVVESNHKKIKLFAQICFANIPKTSIIEL